MLYFEIRARRGSSILHLKLVLLTLPEGFNSLLFLVLCQGSSPQGVFAEMNNYDPSASICFSDPTLAFECSGPSAASEPIQTRTGFAPPPVLQFRSNSVENDSHFSEGDFLSIGLNITAIVLLVSLHNGSRMKEEVGEHLTLTWFSVTGPYLRWHKRVQMLNIPVRNVLKVS